jgi:multidrug efflux system membrane fusion protein
MIRRASRALVVTAVLSAAACSGKRPAPPAEVVPVRVGTVVRRAVPVQLRNVGTVQAFTAVAVRAQVSGEIMAVPFREGQDVKKGQLLFSLDPRPYQAALAQAEAALARDRAQASNADTDVQRYADLVKKDYVTAQQYDSVKANAAALTATVQADEAAVEKSKLDLAYCSIRSPIDGRTGSVMVQVGNVVKANDAVLVTINQIAPIYVAFAVPERDLGEIRRARAERPLPVNAEDPASGKALERGELTFIDNTVDRSTGTITLKATFPNASHVLWPGEFVNAVITLSTEPNALVAPPGAVQDSQSGSYAFVVRPDGTVESRAVKVARLIADGTVVSGGLQAGDRVVTDGQLRLRTGSKIEILGDAKAGEGKRS